MRLPSRHSVRALATLGLVAALYGCDSSPITGPGAEGNVVVHRGTSVEVREDAILVNGSPMIRHGHPNQSLWIEHSADYTYGGIPGVFQSEALKNEGWFARFSHRLEPVVRGDTTIFDFLDYGAAALEGSDFWKITTPPQVPQQPGSGRVVRYERLALYGASIQAERTHLSGGTTQFERAPYFDRMVRGEPLTFTATGSADVAPVRATVSVRGYPSVKRMTSGAEIDFASVRPVLRSDQPLLLELDRTLDPDRTVLFLAPAPRPGLTPDLLRKATVYLRLKAAADRVVVPAEVLRELKASFTEPSVHYLLYVMEVHNRPDAVQTTRKATGERISLPFVQRNVLRFWVQLQG